MSSQDNPSIRDFYESDPFAPADDPEGVPTSTEFDDIFNQKPARTSNIISNYEDDPFDIPERVPTSTDYLFNDEAFLNTRPAVERLPQVYHPKQDEESSSLEELSDSDDDDNEEFVPITEEQIDNMINYINDNEPSAFAYLAQKVVNKLGTKDEKQVVNEIINDAIQNNEGVIVEDDAEKIVEDTFRELITEDPVTAIKVINKFIADKIEEEIEEEHILKANEFSEDDARKYINYLYNNRPIIFYYLGEKILDIIDLIEKDEQIVEIINDDERGGFDKFIYYLLNNDHERFIIFAEVLIDILNKKTNEEHKEIESMRAELKVPIKIEEEHILKANEFSEDDARKYINYLYNDRPNIFYYLEKKITDIISSLRKKEPIIKRINDDERGKFDKFIYYLLNNDPEGFDIFSNVLIDILVEKEVGPEEQNEIEAEPEGPNEREDIIVPKIGQRYVSTKQRKDLPQQVLDEIKLMSVGNSNDTNIYGSYAYRVQKYPSDIDLIEDYQNYDSKEKTIKKFVRELKLVVKNIKSKREHYYSELKAGIDKRYAFPIGTLSDGIYSMDNKFKRNVIELYRKKLLDKDDYSVLQEITIKGETGILTADDYDVVNYILRKYKILRWSAKEVLAGHKILRGGKKITLEEAITHPTILKLDEITFVDGQIVEITNMYQLQYYDKNSDEFVSIGYIDNHFSLIKEVEKLYYSNLWYNPFKAIKRVNSWCNNVRTQECIDIINKSKEIFRDDAAQLYQIKAKLNTINLLIKLSNNPPWAAISRQINSIHFAILNNLKLSKYRISDMVPILRDIEKIAASNKLGSIKKDKISKHINTLIDEITPLINRTAVHFINKYNLMDILNPDYVGYDISRRRTQQSEPKNPLDYYPKISGGCADCGGLCGGMFDSD